MADSRLKQMAIKTAVLKRLCKEETIYKTESEQQKIRVDKLQLVEPRDEYMIKKQKEVLRECLMMIPDCQRRIKKACDELIEILKNDAELNQSKEFLTATETLAYAQKSFL